MFTWWLEWEFFPRKPMLKRKRPYEEIEPAIKPLVDYMNAVPTLWTIASCQGHWYGKPPYIYFKAPVRVAASIEKQLREDAMSDHSKLNANWCIKGMFDGSYEQAFLLYAPDYHQGAKSLFQAIWQFGICRKRLNNQLLVLTHLVNQAMLANLG